MNLRRWLGACLVFTALAGVAYVGQKAAPAGVQMAEAANRFLASLSPEQKAKASLAFDDKERWNWHFIPLQFPNTKKASRKGLPLEDMSAEQKQLALELLKTGTSSGGFQKATTIMSLEAILRELEKGKGFVRNPEWFFVTIFGVPADTGKWGWRVEGHHLSLNFTVDGGKVAASTPAFFGANPAVVKDGPRKGLRTLPEAEDLARKLFASLNDAQRKTAYQAKQFPEVSAQNKAAKVGPAVGLQAGDLTDDQRATLLALLQSYTDRMPAEVAEAEMRQVKEAGLGKVHVAYAGDATPGRPYTYRIHGPTFLVEFLNIQADSANNPANHIHSCWRSLPTDFGL